MKKLFFYLITVFFVNTALAQWDLVYEFTPLPPYGDSYLTKLSFLSADNAIFLTQYYAIHSASYSIQRTLDGFNTVQTVFSEGADYDERYCEDFQFLNINLGFKLSFVGPFSQAMKSVDGGRHWTSFPTNVSLYLCDKLFYLNENFGYFLSDKAIYSPEFEIIVSDSGNCTTYPVSDRYISPTGFIFTNDSTGYILCKDTTQNYLCLKSSDSAKTWTEILNSATDKMQGMHFPSSQIGYVITQNGTLYRTADGGQNWNASYTNATNQLTSLYFENDTLGYIVGTNGLLIKTTDGGQTWVTEYTGINENLEQVYFSGETGYIRTESEKLYKYTSLGINNHEETSENNDCIDIYPNPAKDMLAISLSCAENQVVKIRILDTQAIEVTHWAVLSKTGRYDINNLKPGVYFLQIEFSNKIINKRFIKE